MIRDRKKIEIKTFENADYQSTIIENLGFTAVHWSHQSSKIIAILGDTVRVSVYDLNTGTIGYVKDLKNTKTPMKLSNDGSTLAVLHIGDATDNLTLINVADNNIINCFDTKLRNSQYIEWNPSDDIIMIKERLYDCSVAFYTLNGTIIHRFDRNNLNDSIDKVFISESFNQICFLGFSDIIYMFEFMKFFTPKKLDINELLSGKVPLVYYKEINNGKKFPEKCRECMLISCFRQYFTVGYTSLSKSTGFKNKTTQNIA